MIPYSETIKYRDNYIHATSAALELITKNLLKCSCAQL